MNVSEAVRKRRSVRAYADRAVEREKLMRVLEAARLAPSAKNVQEWKFVVVEKAETRAKLQEAAKGQKFVGEAPVVVAACADNTDYVMTCGQPAYALDAAIAVDHMTLQAVEEGLGSCWIGAFHEDMARDILGVPESYRIVSLLVLGYPAEEPAARPRKDIDEIVVWERWS